MSGRHRSNAPIDALSMRSRLTSVGGSLSYSVLAAGAFTGVFLGLAANEPAQAPAEPASEAISASPVAQDGTVVAVTSDSVTTRSGDGVIQTYRITPETTAVTVDRRTTTDPTTSFEVDDQVSVFVTRQGDQMVATAVADKAAVGPNGPPMDGIGMP